MVFYFPSPASLPVKFARIFSLPLPHKMGKGFREGVFVFLLDLSFKIFLLWVLQRITLNPAPPGQGWGIPPEHSPLHFKNTVHREHLVHREH